MTDRELLERAARIYSALCDCNPDSPIDDTGLFMWQAFLLHNIMPHIQLKNEITYQRAERAISQALSEARAAAAIGERE